VFFSPWMVIMIDQFFPFPWRVVALYVCITPININSFFPNYHSNSYSLIFFHAFPLSGLWCQCFTVDLSYKGSYHLVGILWMVKRWWSTLQVFSKVQSIFVIRLDLGLFIKVFFSHFVILYSHHLPLEDVWEGWETFLSFPIIFL